VKQTPTLSLEVAGFSDIGPVRSENQDAWRALPRADGSLALLLADGMGGHTGGREAAEAAVGAATATLDAPGSRSPLQDAMSAANEAVGELAVRIGGRPGTTLVAALIDGSDLTVANLGDSRAYIVRSGSALQLTEDHSWVGEQVRLGHLSPGEMRRHLRRNVITRAVMGEAVEPDVFTEHIDPGSVLLLCSDGVWEPLEDERIAQILSAAEPLDVLVERLCRSALEAGGTDNATALAARGSAPA
jgi:PPM family protein phosphatase